MLQEFLDAKPLFYDTIDYTRMPKVYERIKEQLPSPKIIHLIGTNGKGTTGRFLAASLNEMGYKVGHYTSPHIAKFNERVWLNGLDVDDEVLEFHHDILQRILSDEEADSLSYFEYTTFLAMLIFNTCDYIVLEAGLGGEHDATAVFAKSLTLVTPIDLDHEAFLGSDIEDIATTKLNAIENNAIINEQRYEVINEISEQIAQEKSLKLYKIDDLLEKEDEEYIKIIAKNLSLAPYLQNNLALAISAIKFFNLKYELEDFNNAKLFGRLSKISSNIIVDVGHNPLAASVIKDSLSPNKYILIYNSYKDKDYQKILSILKPIIKYVELIKIEDKRIESPELMCDTLDELEIEYKFFKETKQSEDYLVFGSFAVVEEFLKVHNE